MKEINVAILGFGFMGRTHLYGYQTVPLYYTPDFKINLVAICNRNLEKAIEAKERYGFELATDNEDEIFARKDIDVIDICTPNSYHKGQILKALDAGKNVYCEKPLVCGADETAEVLAHPNLDKVVTQAAFNNRFYPCTIRAKQLIDEGRLGKILSYRARFIMPGSETPGRPVSWRMTKKESFGGVLYDLGAHVCDMVTHLLGPVQSVYAKTQTPYPTRLDDKGNTVSMELDDAAYIVATMKNGAVGTMEASKLATGKATDFQIEIHGDKGAIMLDFMDPNWLYFCDNTVADAPHGGFKGFTKIATIQKFDLPDGDFPPARHPMGWIRGHVHGVYNFLSGVAAGQPVHPSIREGLYVQHVLDVMYQSAALKKEISL